MTDRALAQRASEGPATGYPRLQGGQGFIALRLEADTLNNPE